MLSHYPKTYPLKLSSLWWGMKAVSSRESGTCTSVWLNVWVSGLTIICWYTLNPSLYEWSERSLMTHTVGTTLWTMFCFFSDFWWPPPTHLLSDSETLWGGSQAKTDKVSLHLSGSAIPWTSSLARPYPERIFTVQEYAMPQSVKEVQRFFRLASY